MNTNMTGFDSFQKFFASFSLGRKEASALEGLIVFVLEKMIHIYVIIILLVLVLISLLVEQLL